MTNTQSVTIIIPVYNEELNIPVLCDRLNSIVKSDNQNQYRVLFIDDGSKDKTLEAISTAQAKYDYNIRFISFSRNFGQQTAIFAGISECDTDGCIVIDADLQDPPELIPEMVAASDEGYEIVVAKRRSREGESQFKKVTASLFYRIFSTLVPFDMPLDSGDFRYLSRVVIGELKQLKSQQLFIRGYVAWTGYRCKEILYDRDERSAGETHYLVKTMIKLAMDAITSFSIVPLKLATVLGFVISGVAFLLILYTLYSKFFLPGYEPGWASIMISILFLGGVQLICLGIIGEYLGRINENTHGRAHYIIKERG